MDKIKLHTGCSINIPFQNYEKDFSFIVNGKEFKTTKFIADMLSPKISKYHLNDPALDIFSIETEHQGNFQFILDLFNFQSHDITENEKPFIYEIANILENEHLEIQLNDTEITIENVFSSLSLHEKYNFYFNQLFQKEIEFISENFYKIQKEREDQLLQLTQNTIELIISNPKLQLTSEDQLLRFVINLYLSDKKYSKMFDYVDFLYVNEITISHFLSSFDIDDITTETWKSLSSRLEHQIFYNDDDKPTQKVLIKKFPYENKDFQGIINFLRKETNGNIENKMTISSSSIYNQSYEAKNIIVFEDIKKSFFSQNEKKSWICFHFNENSVTLSNYTLRSYFNTPNDHPKTWVIQGSNDGQNWEDIDKQEDCPYLNGASLIHTFKIKKENRKEFSYIKLLQTDSNWYGRDFLLIDSIEFYGELK